MSNAVLAGTLILPKNSVNVPAIQTALTVEKVGLYQDQILKLYEESDLFISVPRNWGLSQTWLTSRLSIVDSTVRPYIEWPKFAGSYRTGQEQAVKTLVEFFESGKYGGLLKSKAGSGKTVMGLCVASLLNTPTLILTNKEDLCQQWRVLAYSNGDRPALFPGARVGHVQGNIWNYSNKHFVTALIPTLYSRIEDWPKDFIQSFGLVIIDESHRMPASTFEAVIRKIPAKFRLGVSATWRRTDRLECVWNWHIGKIEHETSTDLVEGRVVQVLWNTNVPSSAYSIRGVPNYGKLLTIISENQAYNAYLAQESIKAANAGRKIVIISHRTEQLARIRELILRQAPGMSVGYYAGKVRDRVIEDTELELAKGAKIILATFQKMGEGTDIPTLDTLYLATPCKDIEQVVGRLQRPNSKKRPILVIDLVWNTKYNVRMAQARKKLYPSLGFKEASR
jgi:superfamily II DNA or RNA helicase